MHPTLDTLAGPEARDSSIKIIWKKYLKDFYIYRI